MVEMLLLWGSGGDSDNDMNDTSGRSNSTMSALSEPLGIHRGLPEISILAEFYV